MLLQPFTLLPDLVLWCPKGLEREMPRVLLGGLKQQVIEEQ